MAAGSPDQLADEVEAAVVVVASPQPRAASHLLERQHFVHSTAQIGNTLRVMVDPALTDPAGAVAQALRDGDLSPDRCERVRPNLEDVFVAATRARKALRAQAA